MLVYQAKNLINEKCYIGQTIQTIYRRKYRHLYVARNNIGNLNFHNEIRKYGEENFEWSILEDNISHENKMFWLEEFYIAYYKTLSTQNGYNIETGGKNYIVAKETGKKISKANLGITKHTFKQRQKRSEKYKNGGNPRARSCFILGIKFDTVQEAHKKLNLTRWNIDQKLKDMNNKDFLYI